MRDDLVSDFLRRLESIKGDPRAQSALVAEFALSAVPDLEREPIRAALDAAAVLHWFDAVLLENMLEIGFEDAQHRVEILKTFSFVETNRRGDQELLNIHESTRLGWRKKIAVENPEYFRTLSTRAAAYFEVAFVRELCNTDRGLVMAANMLDSCTGEQPLVDTAFVRNILLECAELFSALFSTDGTASYCAKIVDEVAAGNGPSERSYLRAAAKSRPSKDSPHYVSIVMKCESFHRFLSEEYKEDDPLPEVLPLIPADSPSSEQEYRSILARITSQRNWCKDDATSGPRFPNSVNCWLSTDRFGPDDSAPKYGDNEAATQARDELGLVDYEKNSYLIQIRFPEAALAKLPDIETARPIFSDRGNSRFMLRQESDRAKQYAKAGWGSDVHLKKIYTDPKTDITGAPSRVAPPLPLSRIDPIDVNFLGKVSTSPYDLSDPNPEQTFRDLVLGSRTKSQIFQELLDLIHGEPP